MMKLSAIAQALQAQYVGDGETEICWVEADSRQVKPGALFFPKKGKSFDGLDFLDEAVGRRASAVVVPTMVEKEIPQLIMDRNQQALRAICACLYDRPTQKMHMIGVTGTNGKTSTCHFIEAILQYAQKNTGYIGTTQYRWHGSRIDAKLTTPMYETLQRYFYQMQKTDVDTVVMECSSHGIELGRIDDIAFDICVYTNLSHEHLDFHHTMQEYENVKAKLFHKHLRNSPKQNKVAIINIEDEVGRKWAESKLLPNLVTYGLNRGADIYPVSVDTTAKGMKIKLSLFGEEFSFFMPTFGTYNIMNMMAAIAACQFQGVDLQIIKACIEGGIEVPGRLQKVEIGAPFTVIVDFAYTEDALRNVLQTLTPFRKNRIITVFGCGGDRDATRRPKMAKAVYTYADFLIMTTDNPRTEDPAAIIDEMARGISHEKDYAQKVEICVDRKQAIEKSLQMAQPGDIILIAGKGHETYQEIHGVRYPFHDQEIVETYWGKHA